MENWLLRCLLRQLKPDSRGKFENSIYGIVNVILPQQFPTSAKFMVKPQGAYRRLGLLDVDNGDNAPVFQDMNYDPDGPDDQLQPLEDGALDANDDQEADVEMAENNNEGQVAPAHRVHHESKTSGGNIGEVITDIPDFIIMKASGQVGFDITVCVVEIKRDEEKANEARQQIVRYLKRAAKENYVVGLLRGFLIMGTTLEVYEVNTQLAKAHGGDAQVVQIIDPTELGFQAHQFQPGQNVRLCSNNEHFIGHLYQISRKYSGPRAEQWRVYQWEPPAPAGNLPR